MRSNLHTRVTAWAVVLSVAFFLDASMSGTERAPYNVPAKDDPRWHSLYYVLFIPSLSWCYQFSLVASTNISPYTVHATLSAIWNLTGIVPWVGGGTQSLRITENFIPIEWGGKYVWHSYLQKSGGMIRITNESGVWKWFFKMSFNSESIFCQCSIATVIFIFLMCCSYG